MVDKTIRTVVENYLKKLNEHGIRVRNGVIFGSQVTDKADSLSDIDLLVISPKFDNMQDRSDINTLWRLAARIDSRIEPIPCGEKQWVEDDSSAIIEIARRNGEHVNFEYKKTETHSTQL
jgi:predicted nucleotidyltransferase